MSKQHKGQQAPRPAARPAPPITESLGEFEVGGDAPAPSPTGAGLEVMRLQAELARMSKAYEAACEELAELKLRGFGPDASDITFARAGELNREGWLTERGRGDEAERVRFADLPFSHRESWIAGAVRVLEAVGVKPEGAR